MKINHLVKSQNYLYEGLDASSLRSIKLWESAGRKLVEYEMTADQITKLFGQVQQGATDAGGNRTVIGKGKDAADAVGKAWEDLKTKVSNSGPIKNVDAQYDKAAEKLKKATGGDAGVMKYVEKYRKFAKEHPVAQSLIYAALIAAAGISGVGAGGAAALGLLKMTDKLLQGEKFSSAAYAGAKTGAVAYGAGQVGKALQGGDQATGTAPGAADNRPATGYGSKAWDDARDRIAQQRFDSGMGRAEVVQDIAGKMGMSGAKHTANFVGGVPVSINGVPVPTNLFTPDQLANINAAKAVSSAMNEAQIKRMFYTAARIQQLNEGVWDKVKGAAGAVANKAQTIGTNLTTKVTADKLMTAWKQAGSPTDSDAVAAIMKQAGVDDAIIASSMKSVSGQSAPATTTTPGTTTPADAAAPAPVDAQTQKFIQQLVASYQALTPAEKSQLKKELEDAVTASDVGGNVVKGTMESRRSKKRAL
jgi:hypothetical protein